MKGFFVAACLLVGLSAVAAYAPVTGFDFVVCDDPVYVTRNPLVRDGLGPQAVLRSFISMEAGFWMPATWVSLMADRSLWGEWAGGFHLTNLLLHSANAALLLAALVLLTGSRRAGLLAALLFALHPIHVESVAWVTERKDVLSLFFGLLALLAWLGHLRRPSAGRYLGAAVLFALSLMAKPMLVTLPVLLLVLDWWPLGRIGNAGEGKPSLRRLLLEKAPFLGMSAGMALASILANTLPGKLIPLGSLGLLARLADAAVFSVGYLKRGVWPARLGMYYLDLGGRVKPGPLLASILVLAVVSVAALGARRRAPFLAAGWAWYLVALLPVSGLAPLGDQVIADRFVYLPFIGIYWAAAAGVMALSDRRGFRWGAAWLAAAIVAVLFPLTRAQVATWRDSETLFRHAVAVSPESCRARLYLARGLLSMGKAPQAVDLFRQTLRCPSIDAEREAIDFDLGIALLEAGDPAGAVDLLERAVWRDPRNVEALANLGAALAETGLAGDAEEAFRRAMTIDAGHLMSRFNLGVLLAREGRYREAIPVFEEALAIDPRNERIGTYLEAARRLARGGRNPARTGEGR